MTDEILKETCKDLIEAKLGWGSSGHWVNQDFDSLSDQIYSVTGVNLSQTTLKRIWGKVKYDSAPTVTTLNTLAQFLGFANWRDFRLQQTASADTPVPEPSFPEKETEKKTRNRGHPILLPGLTIVLMLLSIISWKYFSSKQNDGKIPAAKISYQFISKKILTRGVPNSVIFEYDASMAPEDSVFIQQSWDNRLRVQVPKDQHLHTSIYYYPGFFQAKLLTGSKVVKEHEIFIQTDGWISLIEQSPVPVYFKKGEEIDHGKLTLSVDKIKSRTTDMKSAVPYVYFANVQQFGELKSDDFIFETSLRSDFKEGSGICQKTEIRLLCEGSMVSVPISAKGCISENNLYCLDHYIKGNENDLSGFGVDFNHFVRVRIQVVRGIAKFFVDEKLAYQIDGITRSSKINGIIFRFQDTGSVDWVKLSRADGTVVYADEFQEK